MVELAPGGGNDVVSMRKTAANSKACAIRTIRVTFNDVRISKMSAA